MSKKINRVYKDQMEFNSDVFKLEEAKMIKNASWDDKNPIPIGVGHCHIFRTMDSAGKKLDKAHSVAGHTHEIKVNVDSKGNFVAECSPPISNKPMLMGDNHTHEVTYIGSNRIELRKFNKDAQQFIQKESM